MIVKILAAFGEVKFVCFIKIEETARGSSLPSSKARLLSLKLQSFVL